MECPALEDLRSYFYVSLYFTPLSPIDKSKYILCATNHSGLIGKKFAPQN